MTDHEKPKLSYEQLPERTLLELLYEQVLDLVKGQARLEEEVAQIRDSLVDTRRASRARVVALNQKVKNLEEAVEETEQERFDRLKAERDSSQESFKFWSRWGIAGAAVLLSNVVGWFASYLMRGK